MFASKLHEHESLKTKQNTSFDSFTTKKNLHYTVTESCIAQCLLKELIKNIDKKIHLNFCLSTLHDFYLLSINNGSISTFVCAQ